MLIAEKIIQLHIIFYQNFVTILVNIGEDVRKREIFEITFSDLDQSHEGF